MLVLLGTLLLACPSHCTLDRFGDGTRFVLVDTEHAMYVCTLERRRCWVWKRASRG